jgi:hypothetical protein
MCDDTVLHILAAVLIFLLCLLDALSFKRRALPGCSFYLPKIVFGCVWLACAACVNVLWRKGRREFRYDLDLVTRRRCRCVSCHHRICCAADYVARMRDCRSSWITGVGRLAVLLDEVIDTVSASCVIVSVQDERGRDLIACPIWPTDGDSSHFCCKFTEMC